MESLEGHFLIAAPELLDPNFVKTVVLMIQHNDQGALGLVINRPTSKRVDELWREVGQEPCQCRAPVYLGGPVTGPLMAIHTAADLAEIEVVDGLFFSARKQNLDRLVLRADRTLKMCVGHSGWGPGQLEKELTVGGWIVVPAGSGLVFGDDKSMWRTLVARSRSRVASMLNIRAVPPDPSVN